MKGTLMNIKTLLFFSLFLSHHSFGNEFVAAKYAHDKVCNIEDKSIFTFAKAYEKMNVQSYLNDDMTYIKEMSQQFQKEYDRDCKEKGHYSFNPQACFNKCHKGYTSESSFFQIGKTKEKRMHDLCLSACSFLDNHLATYIKAHYTTYLNEVLNNKKCSNDFIGVDNTSRGRSNKEIERVQKDASDIVNEATGQ